MTDLPSDIESPTPGAAASGAGESDDAAGSFVQSRQLSIGEVLALVQTDFPDVTISKIRFLESRGLVTPHRAPSGYRKFGDAEVERLRWILTMQRDHFLPLRVIKERLDAGEDVSAPIGLTPADSESTSVAALGGDNPANATAPASASPDRKPAPEPTPTSRFRAPGPDTDMVTPDDFARLASLDAAKVNDLVKFGLIDVEDTDSGPRYSRDSLRVARAAGAFLRHGIEPRHLKAWRVAAEREAGMLEQILTPMARQGSAEAARQARETADTLIDMGNVIREAILVRTLREGVGIESD